MGISETWCYGMRANARPFANQTLIVGLRPRKGKTMETKGWFTKQLPNASHSLDIVLQHDPGGMHGGMLFPQVVRTWCETGPGRFVLIGEAPDEETAAQRLAHTKRIINYIAVPDWAQVLA